MQGNSECVKVAIRCRPMSTNEKAENHADIIHVDSSKGEVYIKGTKNETDKRCFTFDYAFDKNVTQKMIFEKSAKDLVDFVIKGYNGTIFAYGQTGTGKTHTMQGGMSELDQGITPRSFLRIFEVIKKSEKTQYLVQASMFELYNEEVNDLLKLEGQNLKIRDHPEKGFFIDGLEQATVTNEKDLMRIMDTGSKNRKTSCTGMNDKSSRSHCVFVVYVESQTETEDGEKYITAGKLNLVDLAGSEKQKKTHINNEQQKKEAIKINLSLTTLRKCISELVKGTSSHVPFRDSKLTLILKDSLGGNTKTFMIANIGPSDFNAEESLSTLKYAYGAKSIKNKPKINEDPKDAAIRQFTDEIEFLKAQLSNMNSGNGQELDPKTLMLLMGNKGDDKMAEMLAKRQEELHRQKEDLNNKKKEIEEMRQLRLKNGENADKVELEFNQMENELEKRQAAIDQENIQKAQLLDNLSKLEEQMVVGSKETEKLKMKKQELENYKLTIKGDIESYDAVEKVLRKEEENKEILDKKNKNLQSQLNQLDKEINQKNIELTLIGTKINEFEANAKEDKELILKEIEDLNLELMSHERIIKSLIPHNVEQVLSSLVQWNEETETWDLVKNQKIAPRYERPFSIYPVRKPIARSKAGECQYQNSMLKSKGKGLVFWKDHQMNANNVLSNDGYLNNQLAQMNPSELEAQVISTKELEELELQTREKEEKELEEAKRKSGTHAKPEKKEEVKPVQLKKEPAKKGPVKNAVMDEESFPEARGNRTKGRF